ncbi:response regulator [Thiosocius teredinicola]|uniref:response regulator n=1 Tax=Thiosocius teredinicola TaxID=1973002 RepID=UPI0009910310
MIARRPPRKRLLIVDDDAGLCQMLAWEFEDLGYDVELAYDCREGGRCLSDRRFDAILLDYHLPDGNGVSLMRQMRHRQPGAVWGLMSADSVNGGLPGCLQHPPVMPFFAKPVSPLAVDAELAAMVPA